MPKAKRQATMTELLRQALSEAGSLYRVSKETGLAKPSLIRFLRHGKSLRLDLADKLAAHLGIECNRRRAR